LVGKKVMIVAADAKAVAENGTAQNLRFSEVYVVTQEKDGGKSLWFNDAVGGWVSRDSVLPYDEVVDHFNKLVEKEPTAENYEYRAYVRMALGELEPATRDLDEMIRLQPIADGYATRGNVWLLREEYDRAIEDYKMAIAMNPDFAAAYTNRGIAWDKKGDYGQAIVDYKKALRLDPSNPFVCNNLAWLLATCPREQNRDPQRSLELATKACELTNWKDPTLLDTLSAAYAATGDFEKAKVWLKKSVELDPESNKDIRLRMWIRYKAGKPYIDAVSGAR
jgi:tetratricopeptide (TPR) repeat protein